MGVPLAPVRQGSSNSVTITTVAPAAPAPNRQTPNAAPVTVHQFVPPTVHGGTVVTTPTNPVRQPPGVVTEFRRPPHRPHRPPRPIYYYPYYSPGAVIIESPYYFTNSVVTEVAPGVVREERRYSEDAPVESRTRVGSQLAPFDPTPSEVVDRMLHLAAVKPGDLLYDLGAGDGRMVIAAAKKYGIKAVGFEVDPGLVKLARENIRKQGVERLVEIRQQDFLTADLSQPSIVTLYLSYDGNLTVRPRLLSQLKAGARVISYTFDMAEWQPKVSENYRDGSGSNHMIYLWEIGAPLAFNDTPR
jgi:hypothetical protein